MRSRCALTFFLVLALSAIAPPVFAELLPLVELTDVDVAGSDIEKFYVTSDAAGTHTVSPGASAFGVDLTGVAKLDAYVGGSKVWSGSGALLWDRATILTAAHVLHGADSITATFETSGGNVVVSSTALKTHPSFDPVGSGFLKGFDIGVVNLFGLVDPSVPSYHLYTDAISADTQSVKAGFGKTGHGSTGATTSDGKKRAGLNTYDVLVSFSGGQPVLAYDFDSGEQANNASNIIFNVSSSLGYGDDEVGAAPGDSGGPTFIFDPIAGRYEIAGVTSFGIIFDTSPDPNPDFVPGLNSSWGEMAFDAGVADNAAWIQGNMGAVPEPTSMAMWSGVAAFGLLIRRRRRNRQDASHN